MTTRNDHKTVASENPDRIIHRTINFSLPEFDCFKEIIRSLGTNNNSDGFMLILKAYLQMTEESEGTINGTNRTNRH